MPRPERLEEGDIVKQTFAVAGNSELARIGKVLKVEKSTAQVLFDATSTKKAHRDRVSLAKLVVVEHKKPLVERKRREEAPVPYAVELILPDEFAPQLELETSKGSVEAPQQLQEFEQLPEPESAPAPEEGADDIEAEMAALRDMAAALVGKCSQAVMLAKLRIVGLQADMLAAEKALASAENNLKMAKAMGGE